jgi:hypothetical protein
MPYYFGEGDPGWDELMDESADEERPPKASQFRYLTPPELGGPAGPARFSDRVPPPRAAPAPATPSLLDRLLGRKPSAAAPIVRPSRQEQEAEDARRSQHWLALIVAALREIGARHVYGRYDGGNDEGFAWLDHVALTSGERLVPDEVARRLAAAGLRERLAEAGLWHDQWGTGEKAMRDIAIETFATECAVKLLGGGYGTGPFYLYGAFTVDLDTCTVVDDRNAEPVVENIEIER